MDSSRRCLPPWMLRAAASQHASMSGAVVDDKQDEFEEQPSRTWRSRAKVQIESQERETSHRNPCLLKKCGVKRGKSNWKKQDTNTDGFMKDDDLEQNSSAIDHERFEKPESRAETEDYVLKQHAKRAGKSMSKVQMKQFSEETQSHMEASLEVNSLLLRRCEAKGSKWKPKQDDGIQEDDKEKYAMIEGNFQNKAPSKKCELKRLEPQPRCETEESIPSDEELTVEDLVHIAKEHVKVDEDKHPRSSSLASESGRQIAPTTTSRNESGSYVDRQEGNEVSQNDTSAASHHNLTECLQKVGSTTINTSMSGDPAQDMLDLFLGPLLRKPEKMETTEVNSKKAMLDNDPGRQVQHKAVVPEVKMSELCEWALADYELSRQSRYVGTAVASTKKKVSLKEKVAMFLD